jgi:hypothetical protein
MFNYKKRLTILPVLYGDTSSTTDDTLFFDGVLDLFEHFIISRGLLMDNKDKKWIWMKKIDKWSKMANHTLTGSLEPTIQENNINPMFKESRM